MNPQRRKYPEIALALQLGVPHLERVAQGIREYAGTHTNWRFLQSPESHHLEPSSLKGWTGDGVIALCNRHEDLNVLAELGCPVVNISGVLENSPFPRVRNDYRQLGRLAAGFLRNRGYRRFGFYGMQKVWYSDEIEAGFREIIEAEGLPLSSLHSISSLQKIPSWQAGQEQLDQWLQSMTPPFALLGAHDPRAAMLVRACERLGLQIPLEAGVLGINDDSITCETCAPTLSSIDRNSRELGWKVAETLHRMLRGEEVEREQIIEPGQIIQRDSTRATVTEHPALRAAVTYAEAHYGETIGVEQIAQAAGRSRRWVENAFRDELQISPSHFLKRVRVQAALELLKTQPGIKLGKLASDCGFSSTRHLNAAIESIHGQPARAFRKNAAST